jgi:hypothetical protein
VAMPDKGVKTETINRKENAHKVQYNIALLKKLFALKNFDQLVCTWL